MRAFLFMCSLGCSSPQKGTVQAPADTGHLDSGGPSAPEVRPVCNGYADLCDRALDEVTFAATHNSMSSAEREWLGPNHLYAVPTQLADGIRALNFDIHDVDGVPTLCHGYCELGSQPLVDGLVEIGTFMTEHPREVVLLTLENYVSADATVAALEESGLQSMVWAQHADAPWPTLGDMVETGQRLVVFTSDGGGAPDWYHAMWDWWRDNPYAAETVADFSCDHYRGAEDNDLYAINHFLTAPISLEALAEEANDAAVILEHVERCRSETGRSPNLVMVDFYSIGDVVDVVDTLNGH